MSHYQHLTISERESIWENKLAGKSLREIARTNRTLCIYHQPGIEKKWNEPKVRSLLRRKRNMSGAENAAAEKRLLQEGELKDLVVRLLTQQQWSPEQIAQRIELEEGGEAGEAMPPSTGHCTRGLWRQKGDKEEPAWKISQGEAFEEKRLAREGKKGQKSRHFIHQTIEERPARSQQAQRDWALGRRSGLQQLLQALCGDTGRPGNPASCSQEFPTAGKPRRCPMLSAVF